MSVKIFLPSNLFFAKKDCAIYGEIQISENNAISYFVLSAYNKDDAQLNAPCHQFRLLGHIECASSTVECRQKHEASISFSYDETTSNIHLKTLSIKPPNAQGVNVFLYEPERVIELYDVKPTFHAQEDGGDTGGEQRDDLHMLYYLLKQEAQAKIVTESTKTPASLILAMLNFVFELMTRLFMYPIEYRPIFLLMQKSTFYEHYREWKLYRNSGQRKANIALDRILGICVMLMLLLWISHPVDYLNSASRFIIYELRLLLDTLKGSPIGLKLNVHLNNFLLDCFNYHVDLWATFLNIIDPFVRQLFLPIALFGSMGLSYQLALLADLISIVGMHAHYFYIYAAVLYKVEINGLQVLWKVMLGKRWNVLKNRVESHNYLNRQLYLASIFFTSLLFLFPTILVYYCVFTTVRMCIYLVNLILKLLRRHMLEFPLENLLKWFTGSFFKIESIKLKPVSHEPAPLVQPEAMQLGMSVFALNIQNSSLGGLFSCKSDVLQELTTTHEQTTFKSIFMRILMGRF